MSSEREQDEDKGGGMVKRNSKFNMRLKRKYQRRLGSKQYVSRFTSRAVTKIEKWRGLLQLANQLNDAGALALSPSCSLSFLRCSRLSRLPRSLRDFSTCHACCRLTLFPDRSDGKSRTAVARADERGAIQRCTHVGCVLRLVPKISIYV